MEFGELWIAWITGATTTIILMTVALIVACCVGEFTTLTGMGMASDEKGGGQK